MKSNGEKNFIENLKDKKCASIHAAIKKYIYPFINQIR